MKTLILLLSLTPLAAAADVPPRPAPRPQVAPPAATPASASDSVLQRVGPTITAVGISRSACYGTCPAYSLHIEANGTFTYEGFAHVERIGRYTGTLPADAVSALIRRFVTARFDRFESRYSRRVTDSATVETSMQTREGTKTVSNYAHAGPPELQAIEDAFGPLLERARWDQPAGAPLTPIKRRPTRRHRKKRVERGR